MFRFYFFLISVPAVLLLFPFQANAKLGQRISSFKLLNRDRLKLKEVVIRDEKKFFSFDLLLSEEKLARTSGFKAGMTVTVESGRITGQSLAIFLGTNLVQANMLAVEQTHLFACEALGRKVPLADEERKKESALVQHAIFLAFTGKPQELKFPGSAGRVIFKRGPEGSLLVAALSS